MPQTVQSLSMSLRMSQKQYSAILHNLAVQSAMDSPDCFILVLKLYRKL